MGGGRGEDSKLKCSPLNEYSLHVHVQYKCKCNFVALQYMYLDVTLAGVSIGNEILQRFVVGMIDLGEGNVHRCRKKSHVAVPCRN